jgi:hypothetical protein
MHYRDKLRKRLLPIRVADPGDGRVMAGEREAGTLRGVPAGGVQLALLRMELADQPLRVGDAEAELLRPPWLAVEKV